MTGDGIPDAVTGDNTRNMGGGIFRDGGVSLYLGSGDGRFQSEQRLVTNREFHTSIALANLDGTNHLDIVTTVRTNDQVSVLLNNGDGTFQDEQLVDVGGSPEWVAIANIDDDETLDLAVANGGEADLSVLLGNGDGTFGPELTPRPSLGDEPSSLFATDLNNDDKTDLVTTNSNDQFVVLLGNNDGTFQEMELFPAGDNALSPIAADLNKDGKPDLTSANSGSNSISVLPGKGDGTFEVSTTNFGVGTDPVHVVTGKLNSSDEFIDLVVANQDSHDISILLGVGDGTFQPQKVFNARESSNPSSVASGLIDDDAIIDIAISHFSEQEVWILPGNDDGTFQSHVDPPAIVGSTFSPGVQMLALGALDDDAFLDLVTANRNSDEVSVLFGVGDGTFGEALNIPLRESEFVGLDPMWVAVANINNDTNQDIVTANRVDSVSVLLGNGDGTFQDEKRTEVDGRPITATVADLNDDGKLDVMTVNEFHSNISVVLGRGDGIFQEFLDLEVGIGPSSVGVGDVNGDLVPDIVVTNGSGDNISVLLGIGDGTFISHQLFYVGNPPESVVIADFNEDGWLDLAFAIRGGSDVSVLLHQ